MHKKYRGLLILETFNLILMKTMSKRKCFSGLISIFLVVSFPVMLRSQESEAPAATPASVKTGWTFGALPVITYNSDVGLRYGGLTNLYYFGDGSTYPAYMHSIYLEWSRTTKGNGFNNLFYDSWYLIPATRTTVDLLYLTEQALDFYGFNGYDAPYFRNLEDPDALGYKTRMYYRHDRRLLRLTADFQRRLLHDQIKWIAGVGFFGMKIAPVDIQRLNKGKDPEDLLPEVPGLFEEYVQRGLIPQALKDGGNTIYLKAGLVQDSRDNEANPMRGTWNEAFVMGAPSFLGNGDFSYLQLVLIHRHYFTLLPGRLSLANRLGYQGKVAGDIPFYMLPFIFSSYKTFDGFGGDKTTRGVIRNRIQGDGIAYGNFELRYQFLHRNFLNQDFYLALSGFADAARVVQKHPVNQGFGSLERMHWTWGGGFRIVMNHNFILAIDYGKALKQEDGNSGLYIGLGFLY